MSYRLELISAGVEQQPVLANLLELYIHDFSEFVPTELGADGRFGYPRLALYWSDPRRRPFLARIDGQWAGFVLVQRDSPNDIWDMTEFFVLRRYRRRGVGTELALQVWRSCPGPWQVRVRAGNAPALKFWRSAIEKFTGHPPQSASSDVDGVPWHVFSFESAE